MGWKNFFELNKKYWWFFPSAIFLVWRIFLEVAGRLFLISSSAPAIIGPSAEHMALPIWARWDSMWYLSIVEKGYSYLPNVQSNVAFFPVYPLLWKLFEMLFGGRFLGGLVVSNLFAFGFVLVFYKLAFLMLGDKKSKRALLALLLFPTSVFLVAAYTESVFLFFLSLSALFTYKEEYKKAALAAMVLSACRVTGILWWPTLLIIWYLKNKKIIFNKDLVFLLFLPPLGLIVYSVYLFFIVGDPLAWMHVQSAWWRKFVWPHQLIIGYLYYIYYRGGTMYSKLTELAALLFASTMFFRVWILDKAYAIFLVLCLLPSLFSGTLNSLERYIFCIPFMFLALAKEKDYWFFAYLSVSFVLFLIQIIRFVNFSWAG